jgi:FkbM family methyltransferase
MNPLTIQKRQSFSQFGEDIDVLDFFGKEFQGIFVDVGANDGVELSNTYLLEQHGWRGVLVEASEQLANACRQARPRSIVVNKAAVLSRQVKQVEFFEYTGRLPTGEIYDGLSSVGQLSAYHSTAIAAGASVRRTVVPAACLDEILDEAGFNGQIDFVSVDVEGLELDVLKGLSLRARAPRLLLVEDNSFGQDRRVVDYLRGLGYFRVHRTGVNDWFVRKPDRFRFLGRRLVLAARLSYWPLLRLIRRYRT